MKEVRMNFRSLRRGGAGSKNWVSAITRGDCYACGAEDNWGTVPFPPSLDGDIQEKYKGRLECYLSGNKTH